MTPSGGREETREERLSRVHGQVVLAAARLRAHRGRCGTCGSSRGRYDGLCLLGADLRRRLDAAGRVSQALENAVRAL